jgi:5-deoxy-5-amino-3-dehydroquinate synthase
MTDVVRVELGERSYDVVVGADAIDRLASVLAGRRRVIVVTQERVPCLARATGVLHAAGVSTDVAFMGDGEDAKSLATVEHLCTAFASKGLLRGDAVVALGGGVVGDTAGFAAAAYHRGVALVHVPTTLLAMVDSAIGGKTAVNLPLGKNLVGAFHQPLAVLADPAVLGTLPDREYRCGLGEVAKYALMGDAELAVLCEQHSAALAARDPDVVRRVVVRSAAIKASYVSADERETSGQRAQLNYGHTLAHAIETVADHALAHGEAVAVGLVFAGALAGALERIPRDAADRHRAVVGALGLPTAVPPGLRRDALLDVMRRDKKAAGGLTFVLLGPNGLERVDDPPAPALDAALAAVGVRD